MSVVLSGRNKHSYLFPFGTNEMIGWATVTLPRYHGYHPCCYRSGPHARTRKRGRGTEARKNHNYGRERAVKIPSTCIYSQRRQTRQKTLPRTLPALLNDLLCFALNPGPVLEPTMRYLSPDSECTLVFIRVNNVFIMETLTCKTPYML